MQITFLGALTILFIGLKLANVIAWSWWWVLSPLLVPFAIFLPLIIIGSILMFIRTALSRIGNR